jgi:hypothetical protein
MEIVRIFCSIAPCIYRKDSSWIEGDSIESVEEMIINLFKDDKGNFWMGTREEGVLRLNIHGYEGKNCRSCPAEIGHKGEKPRHL